MSQCMLHVGDATESDLLRFAAKVSQGHDDCWYWLGTKAGAGYGTFWYRGTKVYAHRFAYEQFCGPIPNGTEIDHLCGHYACANPAHLEAVSHRVNVLRGNTFVARQHAQTICCRGHLLNVHAYVGPSGKRQCRACRRFVRKPRG